MKKGALAYSPRTRTTQMKRIVVPNGHYSVGLGRLPGLKKKLSGITAAPQREHRSYFVRQQLRAQLAHDLWWIVLAVFLIMIIENTQFDDNPTVFSVFNVIFEVVR